VFVNKYEGEEEEGHKEGLARNALFSVLFRPLKDLLPFLATHVLCTDALGELALPLAHAGDGGGDGGGTGAEGEREENPFSSPAHLWMTPSTKVACVGNPQRRKVSFPFPFSFTRRRGGEDVGDPESGSPFARSPSPPPTPAGEALGALASRPHSRRRRPPSIASPCERRARTN